MPSDDTDGRKSGERREFEDTVEEEQYGLLGPVIIGVLVMAIAVVLAMQTGFIKKPPIDKILKSWQHDACEEISDWEQHIYEDYRDWAVGKDG